MGDLRITEKGLKLEGDSEFLKPLYAKEIRSRPVSCWERNKHVSVALTVRNHEVAGWYGYWINYFGHSIQM